MENKEKELRIFLAPSYELAMEVMSREDVKATVEAEYGSHTMLGELITMAHHGANSHNPAPCNWGPVPQIEDGVILVSHLDLDTIGGVMKLLGIQPEDPEFWSAAEFIDTRGPQLPDRLEEWKWSLKTLFMLQIILKAYSGTFCKATTNFSTLTRYLLNWTRLRHINISSVHKTRDHYQKIIWKSLKKITEKITKLETNCNLGSQVVIICPIYRTVFETYLCNTIYASYRHFSYYMTTPSNDMF